ncbi:hypothetical protein, partial [Enterococcus faecium]
SASGFLEVKMSNSRIFFCVVLFFFVFVSVAIWRAQQPLIFGSEKPGGRVVVSAPIVLLLYGGDRYLAANLETVRLAATGADYG